MGTAVRAAAARPTPGERGVGGIAYLMGTIGINREAERSVRAGSTLFLSGVKRVDSEFEAGSVVELADVRHPERLIGRGSVSMSSAALRLLRALTTDEVADVLSILFRLRHAPAIGGPVAEAAPGREASLLHPQEFADLAHLTRPAPHTPLQAYAELSAATA